MKNKIILWWLMTILWLAFIFYLSSIPDLASGLEVLYDTILRKLAHAAEYVVLASLFFKSLKSSFPKLGLAQLLAFSFFLTVLYSISDEWHQSFVSGRSGQPMDVVIDTVGVIIGLLAMKWFNKIRQ